MTLLQKLSSNLLRLSVVVLGLSALGNNAQAESVFHQMTPAQAQSKAPSPITPVFAEITSFTAYTGPFPYLLDDFTVGQTGTYTVTLASPAISNGVYILRGLFSPSTSAPSTPLGNFMKFKQALTNTSFTVDLTAGETYSALQIFSSGTSSVTLTISGPGCVGFGITNCGRSFVPPLSNVPYVQGLGLPIALDMDGGHGPSLNACLLPALRQILGEEFVYLGQSRTGQSFLRSSTKSFSYFPLLATSESATTPFIRFSNINAMDIVTTCGTLSVVPAPIDLTQLGAALDAQGMYANFHQAGVITTRINGVVTVLRPDFSSSQIPGNSPGFAKSTDGRYRFTDASGNTQFMNPAFLDTTTLEGAIGGTIAVQPDGTVIQTVGGQRWLLVPDGKLSSVPTEHAIDFSVWQDGDDHYSYRVLHVQPFPSEIIQPAYAEGFKRKLLP